MSQKLRYQHKLAHAFISNQWSCTRKTELHNAIFSSPLLSKFHHYYAYAKWSCTTQVFFYHWINKSHYISFDLMISLLIQWYAWYNICLTIFRGIFVSLHHRIDLYFLKKNWLIFWQNYLCGPLSWTIIFELFYSN